MLQDWRWRWRSRHCRAWCKRRALAESKHHVTGALGAGGYTDMVGRLTARYLERALGKPVIVENRVRAGGIVGTQFVANAAPEAILSGSAA